MRELLSRHWNADPTSWYEDGWIPPPPNVWLGTSIENRRFVGRANELRRTPAAVRFISAEPLLGPLVPDRKTITGFEPRAVVLDGIDEMGVKGHIDGVITAWHRDWSDRYDGPGLDLTDIDWLIVGGESGPKHRPMDHQWARDLREACARPCAKHRVSSSITETVECPDCAVGPGRRTAFFVKQMGGFRPGDRMEDLPEDLRIREWPATEVVQVVSETEQRVRDRRGAASE
jgi:hypothetical protein